MGLRKREAADAIKAARKSEYFAKLRNVPSSPRKMRLVVDMVRGQEAFKALGILKFSNKEERLLELNDVKKDEEIKPWQEVYLVEKLDVPPEGVKTATIGDDESIHSVAQRYGMRVKAILDLNPKAKDRPGTRLKLQ